MATGCEFVQNWPKGVIVEGQSLHKRAEDWQIILSRKIMPIFESYKAKFDISVEGATRYTRTARNCIISKDRPVLNQDSWIEKFQYRKFK
jgi:hypothetical protein